MQCLRCKTHQSPKQTCGWCGAQFGAGTQGFDAATGQADLDYVLRWLKQADAPENIVGLQKRGADTFERLSKAL